MTHAEAGIGGSRGPPAAGELTTTPVPPRSGPPTPSRAAWLSAGAADPGEAGAGDGDTDGDPAGETASAAGAVNSASAPTAAARAAAGSRAAFMSGFNLSR